MAGRIPPQFIEDLVSRVDIVDLINSHVPLKKAGKEYQACCPFHDEKTPSFTVNREKQFYHCFGCGAHGTAIGFLMEYEHMEFVEAIEELAHRENIEVPREAGQFKQNNHRPLLDLMQQINQYYQEQLRNTQVSQKAIDYLKNRGLTGEISARYQIGYSPAGWDNLTKRFGQQSQQQLDQGGMLSSNDSGRKYDRFRDRIMFPIHDHRGRVIGFGGRILGDEKPKYLNSPETELFHKGKELYGLYQAQKAERHLHKLMVVEGYMDVIALAQFGINYCVATLGTATTDDHVQRLFKLVPEVIFCFDGDRAGRDAGWKALNTSLKHLKDGREVKFLFLPDGEDPDSLIRQEGTDNFQQRVQQAQPLSSFLFEHLAQDIDIKSLDGQARLVSEAKTYINQIQSGVFKNAMLDKLSKFSGMNLQQPAMGNQRPAYQQGFKKQRKPSGGASTTLSPVRLAVILLLKKPDIVLQPELATNWMQLEMPGIHLLSQLVQYIQQHSGATTATILEYWRGQEEFNALNKLSVYQYEVPEDGIGAEYAGAINRLEDLYKEQRLEALLIKSNLNPLTAEEKQELNQLLINK